MELRPFDAGDWDAFQGTEHYGDPSSYSVEPLIAYGKWYNPENGNQEHIAVVIVDFVGVHVEVFADEDTAYVEGEIIRSFELECEYPLGKLLAEKLHFPINENELYGYGFKRHV